APGGGTVPVTTDCNQEAVFEWFGWHLSPAQRIEFMCGLLHMCQPFELRFLGSCLEDLARKDFYVLRDAEVRANSQSDLGLLVDVGDPVVRSKLLVCLSLLSSGNRECAGILFRTLSHIYSALDLENGGASPAAHGNSGRHHGPGRAEAGSLEQLALLFTMASLHPAFPFHQREAVRSQLDNVEAAISEWRRRRQDCEHLPVTVHAPVPVVFMRRPPGPTGEVQHAAGKRHWLDLADLAAKHGRAWLREWPHCGPGLVLSCQPFVRVAPWLCMGRARGPRRPLSLECECLPK
uniref:Zinc finger, CCHC domain containing 2 n=1 Tax=Denticeps clupeoides TaxID=299321 RepID=A0AAY4ARH8_9TELE